MATMYNERELFKEKYFITPYGEVLSTDGLHESLAREICESRGYEWRKKGWICAADYLLSEKGYIKVSNYSSEHFHYVQYGKKFERVKRIRENAELVSAILNLKISTI